MLDSLSLAGKFYMEGGGRPSLITLQDLPRRKQDLSAKIWLLYFNSILYEKSIITEQERNRMRHLIERRRPPALRS